MTSELIEKSDVSKEEITEIIKPYFSSDQFDDFLFNYIVNMIYIDKPENENELKILIGDYLSDRIKSSFLLLDKADLVLNQYF